MSDVKLEGVNYSKTKGMVLCIGCAFSSTDGFGCKKPLSFEEGCLSDGYIWTIDDSAIETEKPKSPWVKIEDAELVNGEEYWVVDMIGEQCVFKAIYSELRKSFSHSNNYRVMQSVNDVTHVIHLPTPQPPEA